MSDRGSPRRLRVGVVGCGLIAQLMHLPHLLELDDLFELSAVCDISEQTAAECARRYGASKTFTDWERLLDEPLDVVMVLSSGSHAPIAVQAARAGMHVFVEKPMCIDVREGLEMIDAAKAAGVQLMVGTMKRYDPTYERLLEMLPQAGELRLARVTTLESPDKPYLEGYSLVPPHPAPADLVAELKEQDELRLHAALPDADEQTRFCYRWMLLDNLIHELNALRGALGEPDLVKHAELSERVVGINLSFGGVECHLSWVDLPGIARYRQEFALYGLDARATLTWPSPYLRGVPSELVWEGGKPDSPHSWRNVETVSYVPAFKRELIELHSAIREDRPARTDSEDGLHDVALCRAIAEASMTGKPVQAPSRASLTSEAAQVQRPLHSEGARR
jgi:predicted dehydrogenase